MTLSATKRITYDEYLALEAASETRHEYISGVVVAMAGGTIEHGRLIARVAALLSRALEGRPCVVLSSDVRVRIRVAERSTYPDLFVVCGEIERDDEDAQAIVNPLVVVEVLSDSTAESDRGDKFAAYRRLRSVREYIIVSQEERRIDAYRREGRRWGLDEHGPGESLRLESLGIDVKVDDAYADALGVIVP
jgi:Uma2 family endonuclease